jgi:hypothetical protein
VLHPERGKLWKVEHGARGGDEINIARLQQLRLARDQLRACLLRRLHRLSRPCAIGWAQREKADASPKISGVALEAMAWLVVRRDQDGNLDVLRMPDGRSPAWELSEAAADAAIAHVQRDHRKVHGQSYWKLHYPRGALRAFLKANNIRV